MCIRLALYSAKHSLFHVFHVNQALFRFLLISNLLNVCILQKQRKRDEKQAIWARNEKVMHGISHGRDHSGVVATIEQKKIKKTVFSKVST